VPIRAELRRHYGPAWKRFRLALIAEHGTICETCKRDAGRRINGAHSDHDPQNAAGVKLWCPSCHARHDAPHRLAIMRRRRAAAAGQLWLLPEIEWAPFASWEIPGPVYDILHQLPLFKGE
jgi:hypothetical protein